MTNASHPSHLLRDDPSRASLPVPGRRRPSRGSFAASLLGLVLLAGCGSSSSVGPATSTTTPTAPASSLTFPSRAASGLGDPVGPDVSCIDAAHCFFRNPQHRTDAQIAAYLPTEPGATKAPAASHEPWPFVVLDAGDSRLDAVARPQASAPKVGDQYGVLNHRVVFAWCRQDGAGHAVSASTPAASTWYQIDPVGGDSTARVWFNGAHLHPYLSNGQIPACH